MPRFLVTVNIPLTIMPDPLFGQMVSALQTKGIQEMFPHVLQSLEALAEQGQNIWAQKITAVPGTEGRPLRLGTGPGDRMVQLNRTAYAQSIRIEPVKVSPGAASVTVSSRSPQAGPIEDGSRKYGDDPMDLHDVLAHAPKAKRSKAGHRYLSIPFRWSTTGPGGPGGQRFQSATNVLPQSVLAVMRSKRISRITGTYQEPSVNAPGKLVTRNRYLPLPGRLTRSEIMSVGLIASSQYGHNLVGLMRVGKRKHHGYLSIRTLSEKNPKGWRVPGYPAQHLVQDTARILQRVATEGEYFQAALKADVQAWMDGRGTT